MPSSETRADDPNVFELSRDALDELPFGVIVLDRAGIVVRFNRAEASLSHRETMRTIGLSFFNDVAPCANVASFRGRFDAFAQRHDSGIERFTFSFAFRWGRQDVSITMLRKFGHDHINILVHTRAGRVAETANVLTVPTAPQRSSDVTTLRGFFDAKELPLPVRCALDSDSDALRRRVHADDLAKVEAIVAAAARARTAYAVEYRGLGQGAEQRIFTEHGCFETDPERASYATIVDITEQRQFEAEAWRAAHYDVLTGLPNGRLLLARAGDAIREAQKSGRTTAMMLANIHQFRNVNDIFGHDVGNAVLRDVSLRVGECVRGGDTVARISADWFGVLLTEIETPEMVAQTATRLISAFAVPFVIADHPHYLALRIGISMCPYDGHDPAQLLRAAETAMFAEKAAGRTGLRFYTTQMTVDAATSLERQSELRAAIENGEFELLYQPLVDIENDRIVAAEALVRWNHPTRGLISPLEFIPLADSTGLIVPLGEWVLRSACRQARAWADEGLDVRVCVNVSTVQFQRPDFVDLVASIIAQYGLAPSRLELELTESIMVDGFAEMIEILSRLKALGLRLAIDDFGTGYSSLAYLKYFPVDTLKVDRAFITDIVTDEFDHAIATAIFTLTRNLALECVVEGVENAEQLETLRTIGCSVVQGFYFSRPTRPELLTASLRAALPRPPRLARLNS